MSLGQEEAAVQRFLTAKHEALLLANEDFAGLDNYRMESRKKVISVLDNVNEVLDKDIIKVFDESKKDEDVKKVPQAVEVKLLEQEEEVKKVRYVIGNEKRAEKTMEVIEKVRKALNDNTIDERKKKLTLLKDVQESAKRVARVINDLEITDFAFRKPLPKKVSWNIP